MGDMICRLNGGRRLVGVELRTRKWKVIMILLADLIIRMKPCEILVLVQLFDRRLVATVGVRAFVCFGRWFC